MSSKEFAAGLGYMGQEEVCHRANICLLLIPHDDSGGWAALFLGALLWVAVCGCVSICCCMLQTTSSR